VPKTIFTVSEISGQIKNLLERNDVLRDVSVTGEVSNFKRAISGHCYFTLKDASASLKAVIWRSQAFGMTLPGDGDSVTVHGAITVYARAGEYQLSVDHITPAGIGGLWQEFARLKERLLAEGLFDEAEKRAVPRFPVRLGIATSPDAAALQDILRTLRARYRCVEVIIAPTLVQGTEAPAAIVRALRLLNRYSESARKLDVIILARGGGSLEELWAFNDERVARAIRASVIPVISGVGHETDTTIADFAADVRASTPTGAATLAVPAAAELKVAVGRAESQLRRLLRRNVVEHYQDVAALSARLARCSPSGRLKAQRQATMEQHRRLQQAIRLAVSGRSKQLAAQKKYLASLDPTAVLGRGYAIVSRSNGVIVSSLAEIALHDPLRVRVSDGTFGVQVTNGEGAAHDG
jgi:exodeoxyribonuclease VII large subunit